MTLALYTAAALLVAVGAAHSVLGERYLLMRPFRRRDLPRLFGGTAFTVRTLRFAWHVTTIAWWGLAAVFVMLAHPPVSARALSSVLAATLLATAALMAVVSRARHLAWILFAIAGGIAAWAALA